MAKPPSSVRSVRLTNDEWDTLSKRAEALGTTVNTCVAEAVRGWLVIGPKTEAERDRLFAEATAPAGSQAARDAKFLRGDTWNPAFAATKRKK